VKDDQILHIQGKSSFANLYHDINENSTMFLKEILTVTELGIFKGDKKGNLRTKGTFTRAEMEQIIKNAFPYSVKAPH